MVAEPQERDEPIWLSPEEERVFFDRQARALLGISGDEFRRRYTAGEYAEVIDDPEQSDLMYLALLAGVAR